MLQGIGWQFVTNVLGNLSFSSFRVKQPKRILFDCLSLEVRTDRLSRNVGKHLPLYVA